MLRFEMANNSAAALAGTPQPAQTGGGGSKPAPSGKPGNVLPLWGNEKTMNLNPMILTNILSSPYFKVQLYELKTYHEVVDEIYFKVRGSVEGLVCWEWRALMCAGAQ